MAPAGMHRGSPVHAAPTEARMALAIPSLPAPGNTIFVMEPIGDARLAASAA